LLVVNHDLIRVDGQRVDSPSYLVKPGQEIEMNESAREIPDVQELARTADRGVLLLLKNTYIWRESDEMTERLILRQNNQFETEFLTTDPDPPESLEFDSKTQIHELTPYGLFLAGLASCTSIVLHSYAQNHGLDLKEVELRLTYERVFKEDCENCEDILQYKEEIEEEILLLGELDEVQRDKLFLVSKQCPIHRIVEEGIEVHSSLVEEPATIEE
jgi:uncharacterized OsmC-like protein